MMNRLFGWMLTVGVVVSLTGPAAQAAPIEKIRVVKISPMDEAAVV